MMQCLPHELLVRVLEHTSPVDYVHCIRSGLPRDEAQYQRKLSTARGQWFITREHSEREDMCRLFVVHDNGGEPWFVRLHGGCIHVDTSPFDWNFFQHMLQRDWARRDDAQTTMEDYNRNRLVVVKAACFDSDEEGVPHDQRLGTIEPEEWVGLWAPEDCNDERGGCAGNTVLVQLTPSSEHLNRYLLITGSIVEFWTENPITRFESPIGNNDVPYPFALTTDAMLFLLPEEMCTVPFLNPSVLERIGWFMRLSRSASVSEARAFLSNVDWSAQEGDGDRRRWETMWWGVLWPENFGGERHRSASIPHEEIYPRRCDWEIPETADVSSVDESAESPIQVRLLYVPRNETDERV